MGKIKSQSGRGMKGINVFVADVVDVVGSS
jgi:hypothetical protein